MPSLEEQLASVRVCQVHLKGTIEFHFGATNLVGIQSAPAVVITPQTQHLQGIKDLARSEDRALEIPRPTPPTPLTRAS